MRWLLHVVLATALSSATIRSAAAARMPPRILKTSEISKAEAKRASDALHKELFSLLPKTDRFLQSDNALNNRSVKVNMSKDDKNYIRNYNKKGAHPKPQPLLEAVAKKVEKTIGKPQTRRLGGQHFLQGGVYEETEGGFTWSTTITSDDALGISVFLTDVSIPEGVKISLINENGDFDNHIQDRVEDGQVWSNTIPGNEVFLLVHYSGGDPDQALDDTTFIIDKVGIHNPSPIEPSDGGRKLPRCGWTDPDPQWSEPECVIDYKCCVTDTGVGADPDAIAECATQDTTFRDTHLTDLSNSVAKMKWWQGDWGYICTGGLINNSQNKVYILTANHCIAKSDRWLELKFHEVNDKCEDNSDCRHTYSSVADITGVTKLSTSRTSDYTLFEAMEDLPNNGETYVALGFNTNQVSVGDKLFRVHHPASGPQSYQETIVSSLTAERNYIYSRSILGETMGGSSGSLIVNEHNEIVGQHYGWDNGNADWCAWNDYNNIDGEFYATYKRIQDFLGPPLCVSGEACDDDDPCTINDVCDGSGVCVGAPLQCSVGEVCQDGACVDEGGLGNICSNKKKKDCPSGCSWVGGKCVLANLPVGGNICFDKKKTDCPVSCAWVGGKCVP